MMAGFSPLTRRLVAIGLLIIAILLALNLLILPVHALMASSLDTLAESRFQLGRLRAIEARPDPVVGEPVPAGAVISAADHDGASMLLAEAITAAAARAQLEVQSIAPGQSERGAQVAAKIAVAGPHDAVLGFVNDLERGSPLARFDDWSITANAPATAGEPVRLSLDATVVAAWKAGP